MDPEEQFRERFRILKTNLAQADLTARAVVEITSYHVGLRQPNNSSFTFMKTLKWTAVGVSELITEGAVAEIRVIAKRTRPHRCP